MLIGFFRKFLKEHDYKKSTDFFRCLTLYEISKKEKNKRKEKEEKYNSDVKSAINKAKDENIISIIKEIMNSEGISSFLFTA